MNTLSRYIIYFIAFLGVVGACAAKAEDLSSKPNIIYLMTDDQRWDNLGCYGRPEFKTDHIDKLAEQGILFERAYYAVSICMPSRVTAMTGRHISSHRTGFVYPNNYTMSYAEMADSYPAVLKRAGYRTGFVGKHGFAIMPEKHQPNTSLGKYNTQEHFGRLFDFFAGTPTHVGGHSFRWPTDDKELAKIYDKKRPANERTLKTGDAMLRFLETQPADQPFCLSVSFLAVKHDNDARDVYPPHAKLFAGKEMPYPKNYVEGPNEKLPKVVRENSRGYRLHVQRTGVREKYQDEVQDFATQAYSVDQQVGRLVAKLEEVGLLDNTVIIFTSDNGRFQGSHGLYDKVLLYEESVKAPLVVFDGRLPEDKRGRRLDALYSSVDHASTILGFAGLEAPESMQGYDFSPLIIGEDGATPPRKAVLMENMFLGALYKASRNPNADADMVNRDLIAQNKSFRCRGVVTKRWKYFIYHEHTPAVEELYDLENDPLEQIDLSGDPAHQATLKRLREQCQSMYDEVAHRP